MEIIITTEDVKTIRKNYVNFKQCLTIDVREVLTELGYHEGEVVVSPHDFIINCEIEKKLQQAINSKKCQTAIYFVYTINKKLIDNVREILSDKSKDSKNYVSIFDIKSDYKDQWPLFDKIVS